MAVAIRQGVSSGDLERLIAEAKQSAPDQRQSIFAPDSISWKINRESALFLAAGRAALLQLAHPWVATAIAQHSRTLHDPIGRFHQTFRVIFTMVFGTVDQACDAARHLHRRHQTIRGNLPDTVGRFVTGSPYLANEVDALRWVYATLVDSALTAYELILPPLSAAEREQYYAESLRIALLFGLSFADLPKDWADFRSYMTSSLQSDMLGVSDATREMAHQLINGVGLKMRTPFWYRALTTELLPPRLRKEFQFSYLNPEVRFAGEDRERASPARALRWLRRIYPLLPSSVRFVGPYNEARARFRGAMRPGFATRMSNRLWIGQASLVSSIDR
jgi:uncharacterized protein (DUF2236 family)